MPHQKFYRSHARFSVLSLVPCFYFATRRRSLPITTRPFVGSFVHMHRTVFERERIIIYFRKHQIACSRAFNAPVIRASAKSPKIVSMASSDAFLARPRPHLQLLIFATFASTQSGNSAKWDCLRLRWRLEAFADAVCA